jgi:alkylhydroperoxidase/carboxymuconolactone decarboxylase family protein YurZ
MQKLCLLAADDEAFLRAQIADDATAQHTGGLDQKTRTLVRLAVLAAIDGPEAAYRHVVRDALRAGATIEETVDVLFAIAPTVGTTRAVAASARLAAALGFDLDPALER